MKTNRVAIVIIFLLGNLIVSAEDKQKENIGFSLRYNFGLPTFFFYPNELSEIIESQFGSNSMLGFSQSFSVEYNITQRIGLNLNMSGYGNPMKSERNHLIINNVLYSVGMKYNLKNNNFYLQSNIGLARFSENEYTGLNSLANDAFTLMPFMFGVTDDFIVSDFGFGGKFIVGYTIPFKKKNNLRTISFCDVGLDYTYSIFGSNYISSLSPFISISANLNNINYNRNIKKEIIKNIENNSNDENNYKNILTSFDNREYRNTSKIKELSKITQVLSISEKEALYDKYKMSAKNTLVAVLLNPFFGTGSWVQRDTVGGLWCSGTMVGGVGLALIGSGSKNAQLFSNIGLFSFMTGFASGFIMPYIFISKNNKKLRLSLNL